MSQATVNIFNTKKLTDSIIRPSNTTAYAAGDVISEVTSNKHFTFGGDNNVGQLKGIITQVAMQITSNKTTKPDLELWLFSEDIADVEDNAAFAPSDTEILTLIDVIPLPAADWYIGLAGANAAGNIVQVLKSLHIEIPESSGQLFGQLVVRNSYTPISAELFKADLVIQLNSL